VRDEGIGIPPSMLERIFEPFVRAVDEDTAVHGRPTSGMGLGLSLVRAFVQAHGGDVRARSDGEGKGAELVVELPLAGSFERAAATSFVPRTIDGEAVVLVEDQEDSRTLLSDILQDAGYAVTAVADGKHAVELIMTQRPPIALVDIGLPTMSGYDVAREIRKELRSTDIFLVALTGYGQQQDREAVVSAGFDQHLVKPIEIDTLLEVLRLRRPLRAAMS
jgi:CheY-like chemotaxis protein